MELEPRHYEAAQALAAGRETHIEIAARIGVHRNTLHNWERDPDFTAIVEDYRLEIIRQARRWLGAQTMQLVMRLAHLADDNAAPASVRRQALADLLALAFDRPASAGGVTVTQVATVMDAQRLRDLNALTDRQLDDIIAGPGRFRPADGNGHYVRTADDAGTEDTGGEDGAGPSEDA